MSELLKFKLLPATLINSNFIEGNPDSNYEKYLLEFVNSSPFFLGKSKGKEYASPESEHCGQCDCISENYTLDFKMLVSPTMAQAKKSIYSINLPTLSWRYDVWRSKSQIL